MNSLLMKRCTKCGKEFPATNEYFWIQIKGKFGVHSRCKKCAREIKKEYRKNNGEKVRSQQRAWAKANPDRKREHLIKCLYGISIEQYMYVLEKQNGVCAICGKEETHKDTNGNIRPLAIDHSHKTGEVRGLLCQSCNALLGYSREDKDVLLSTIDYIEKYNMKEAKLPVRRVDN